ncbi:hypothetical protein [Halobacillus yeomjeoni]|uniref:YtxH domain-containing protein n=1 Tax=Halobacillus yeomjeoni TaxID=311194 RepID=A0A931HW08_9BACI|nr:hypothetical protein [Halobacillus yeomjeoni]MBH0230840.1 hypothetical protein [Halobacillus yeomjeoni]
MEETKTVLNQSAHQKEGGMSETNKKVIGAVVGGVLGAAAGWLTQCSSQSKDGEAPTLKARARFGLANLKNKSKQVVERFRTSGDPATPLLGEASNAQEALPEVAASKEMEEMHAPTVKPKTELSQQDDTEKS